MYNTIFNMKSGKTIMIQTQKNGVVKSGLMTAIEQHDSGASFFIPTYSKGEEQMINLSEIESVKFDVWER